MIMFFQWEGWTAVSAICQVLIALFAFLAIVIAVVQVGNRRKVSLSIDFKLGLVKKAKMKILKLLQLCLKFGIMGYPLYLLSRASLDSKRRSSGTLPMR